MMINESTHRINGNLFMLSAEAIYSLISRRFVFSSYSMPTITYTVTVAPGVDAAAGAGFQLEVARVLNDRRGWKKYGYSFEDLTGEVSRADILIRLATVAETNRRCYSKPKQGDADKSSGLSCWDPNRREITINEQNWVTGAASGLPPDRYHNYVISHEVGHALGLDHMKCPIDECRRRGISPCPASVMQQMTLGGVAISPCVANDWPLDPDWGVDNVATPRSSAILLIVLTLLLAIVIAVAVSRAGAALYLSTPLSGASQNLLHYLFGL